MEQGCQLTHPANFATRTPWPRWARPITRSPSTPSSSSEASRAFNNSFWCSRSSFLLTFFWRQEENLPDIFRAFPLGEQKKKNSRLDCSRFFFFSFWPYFPPKDFLESNILWVVSSLLSNTKGFFSLFSLPSKKKMDGGDIWRLLKAYPRKAVDRSGVARRLTDSFSSPAQRLICPRVCLSNWCSSSVSMFIRRTMTILHFPLLHVFRRLMICWCGCGCVLPARNGRWR